MTLSCIGKSRGAHDVILPCNTTSETPTNPKWPDVFLCSACANATPNKLYLSPERRLEMEREADARQAARDELDNNLEVLRSLGANQGLD